MSTITAVSGDITQQPVEAIATLVNLEKVWAGGVDNAIYNVADQYYHSRLRQMPDLENGAAYIITGDKMQHYGQFDHVIFVVDDLYAEIPIKTEVLTYAVFSAAHEAGYKKIAIPLFRDGVARQVFGLSQKEIARSIRGALEKLDQNYQADLEVIVVIWNDPDLVKQISQPGWLLPG